MHGSLLDRGAKSGLADSNVRLLSKSPRKCTITGIDNHELPVLDVVQCGGLVDTIHVNLIMNEYAYYGEAIAFIHQVKLNGTPTLWMTSQSKFEANRRLLPLIDNPCHQCVKVD